MRLTVISFTVLFWIGGVGDIKINLLQPHIPFFCRVIELSANGYEAHKSSAGPSMIEVMKFKKLSFNAHRDSFKSSKAILKSMVVRERF